MGQRPAVMAAWLKTGSYREVQAVQIRNRGLAGSRRGVGWRPVEGMLEGRGGEVEAGAYGGHIAGGRGVTLHLDSWIRRQ